MDIKKEIKKTIKSFKGVGLTTSYKDFLMYKLEVLTYLESLK